MPFGFVPFTAESSACNPDELAISSVNKSQQSEWALAGPKGFESDISALAIFLKSVTTDQQDRANRWKRDHTELGNVQTIPRVKFAADKLLKYGQDLAKPDTSMKKLSRAIPSFSGGVIIPLLSFSTQNATSAIKRLWIITTTIRSVLISSKVASNQNTSGHESALQRQLSIIRKELDNIHADGDQSVRMISIRLCHSLFQGCPSESLTCLQHQDRSKGSSNQVRAEYQQEGCLFRLAHCRLFTSATLAGAILSYALQDYTAVRKDLIVQWFISSTERRITVDLVRALALEAGRCHNVFQSLILSDLLQGLFLLSPGAGLVFIQEAFLRNALTPVECVLIMSTEFQNAECEQLRQVLKLRLLLNAQEAHLLDKLRQARGLGADRLASFLRADLPTFDSDDCRVSVVLASLMQEMDCADRISDWYNDEDAGVECLYPNAPQPRAHVVSFQDDRLLRKVVPQKSRDSKSHDLRSASNGNKNPRFNSHIGAHLKNVNRRLSLPLAKFTRGCAPVVFISDQSMNQERLRLAEGPRLTRKRWCQS